MAPSPHPVDHIPLYASASAIVTLIATGFAVSLAALHASYGRQYLREWMRMWVALAVYASMSGMALIAVGAPALGDYRRLFAFLAIVAAGTHLQFLGKGMRLLCTPDEPRHYWRERVILVLLAVGAVTIFLPAPTDPALAMRRYFVRVSVLAAAWGLSYGWSGLLILRKGQAASALGRRTLGLALVTYGALRLIEPFAHLLPESKLLGQFLTFGGIPLIVALGAGMLVSLLEVERRRAIEEADARAAAEHTATASEALLATALASSSDPVFIADPEGRLIAFNDRFIGLVKEVRDSPVAQGMPVQEIVPTGRKGLWHDIFTRGIAGESQLRLESLRLAPGLGARPYALRITPVVRGGEIIGILVVAHDASEEERLRAALAAREEWFRSMIENASDIIFMVSSDGTIEYASPSLHRVLGREPDALIGANGFIFVHPDDTVLLRDAMERAFARDDTVPATIPFRAQSSTDDWIPLEAVSRPFVEPDGTPHLIVSARDIRERRRLEAELLAARRLESVGRLAGGVAHDFNNLLTAIVGNLSLMRDPTATPATLDGHLNEIESAVHRGAELTRRLLAFARRQMIEPRVLDLGAHVLELAPLLRRLLSGRARLDVDLPATLARVRVDPAALEQIFVNLVVNAADAMPDGGTLTIHGENIVIRDAGKGSLALPAGSWVRVDVTDTGTGIDEAILGQIFEPFFTTKSLSGGTGLGLATVYGTVSQAGGHVRVRSTRGVETTFSLFFPQVAEDEGPPPDPLPPTRFDRAKGDETILVIEDETSVREVTVKLLSRLGYTVLSAVDGLDGVARAAAHEGTIHLILSDLVMPELSGVEAVARIRQARADVPVIFISGFSEEALQWRQGMPSGGRLLSKPFSIEDLARTVRRALDG